MLSVLEIAPWFLQLSKLYCLPHLICCTSAKAEGRRLRFQIRKKCRNVNVWRILSTAAKASKEIETQSELKESKVRHLKKFE